MRPGPNQRGCRTPRARTHTRRTTLIATLLIPFICAACSHQLSRSQFEQNQHRVDELAQVTMASVTLSLNAEPPSDNVWGQGHTQACKFESGKVGYVVDTLVTYYGIDNRHASKLIRASMEKVGISVRSVGEDGVIRGEKDSFTIDATPTGTATNPAGISISFATDCLNVGQDLASELVKEPPRKVQIITQNG